ncbi:MAG: hypothetical protein ACI9LV_000735 [Candidatus Nanohaloarchaea archaeon]|jgi:hypothetical protein
MPDYLEPEWIELEQGETAELEGGESGWTDQGSVYADLRNCIAITAYEPDMGVAGMVHLVAEEMEPEEVTESIQEMWHDASSFADPADFNWYAAGGFPGEADYTEPFSHGVKSTDRAYLRRVHTDEFFEQMNSSYHSEWLEEEGLMQVRIDLDEESFYIRKIGEPGDSWENVFHDSQV